MIWYGIKKNSGLIYNSVTNNKGIYVKGKEGTSVENKGGGGGERRKKRSKGEEGKGEREEKKK